MVYKLLIVRFLRRFLKCENRKDNLKKIETAFQKREKNTDFNKDKLWHVFQKLKALKNVMGNF